MTSLQVRAAAALSWLAVVHGAPASAQTPNGGFAGATVSAITIEDGTSAAIAGTIGYRFNPTVAFGIELMAVPSLSPSSPDIPIPLGALAFDGVALPSPGLYPSPVMTVGSDGGHATIFTTHLRLTIPTRSRRLSPYLVAGAGVGTVTDKLRYTITYPPILLTLGGQPLVYPTIFPPQSESIARTTTDFAVTFGGGISCLTSDHWSLDADARYIGIFGARDIRVGRYGGGIMYRF